jgi:hypothetical protein
MATRKNTKPKLVLVSEGAVPELKGVFLHLDFYSLDNKNFKIGYLGRRFRSTIERTQVLKSQYPKEFQIFRLMQKIQRNHLLDILRASDSKLEVFTVNLYFVASFLNNLDPQEMYLFLLKTEHGVEFLLVDMVNGVFEFTQSVPTGNFSWRKGILLVLGA